MNPALSQKRPDDAGGAERRAVVERQGSSVRLRLTVPAEAVAAEVRAVTEAIRSRVRLAGFRRGRAPAGMVRQRFRGEIRDEVVDRLIAEHLGDELTSRGLRPLHRPVVEEVNYDPDGPLSFTVRFDVAPEVEVRGYTDLRATRRLRPVTEEAVEEALGRLRERAARLAPVGPQEPAAVGDYVLVELELYPPDGRGRRLAQERRYVRVGQERAVPGLNEELPGVRVGDRREFVTRLGPSYPNDLLAGREVRCRLRVLEVKRRHLPAIDDELARDLGLGSLQELRARTREDLERAVEREADRDVERQLLEQILAANPIDVPPSMVERRLDRLVQEAARDLARQGIDPTQGIDWSSLREENRQEVARTVAEELLLDRIAAAEGVEVGDDAVLAAIGRLQGGGQVAALVRRMRKEGSFEHLRTALRRQQALEWVKRHARIEIAGSHREQQTDGQQA